MLETLIKLVPDKLRGESGKVFYSGRLAFSASRPLYLLGLNPGGDPESRRGYTIGTHSEAVLKGPANWSAFRDESWRGFPPGEERLQKRVLHLLKGLALDPGLVPSSNLVFLRSKRFDGIAEDFEVLAENCWPFHHHVIGALRPRVVLCFGVKAGQFVRMKLDALKLQAEWLEKNERRWRNQMFANSAGIKVVVLTHPSIVDWTAESTDPTDLVRRAFQ
jgi:hypothetical protein